MNPKEYPEIYLVTGKKDSDGNKIGMFGDTELGWHSNGNSRHNINKILVALYCVKEDINTTLSICNTSDPFYELSEDDKEYFRSIKIKIKFKNNTFYNLEEDDEELTLIGAHKGSIRKLVGVHPHTEKEYFYFPYHFICAAWRKSKKMKDPEFTDMIERLKKIISNQDINITIYLKKETYY